MGFVEARAALVHRDIESVVLRALKTAADPENGAAA
jgi:hypothetical protein